ncbi:ATP-binding protein [Sutcliffiella rhizosphaerae]|uniref:histidine kinase n=1 Tax=Sutcliffiella rhizosphaerae TaxID=2880967 RepID=A0ABM8YPW5_9BACI|nr:ATP-binding protein [Sutcliffiella rhizosphaerae]CAG9621808.1 Adaptive-response sensory-kinase SasA [Sutcliffiella rhizosphaerae]
MFEDIKFVLYHVLIILFPILFYYQFLNKKADGKDTEVNFRFLVTLLVMLYCTMSFPIEVTEGTFYDQKLIPVILAFLYGGWLSGYVVVVTMFLYLFFYSSNLFLYTIVNYLVVGVLLGIAKGIYSAIPVRKKIVIISSIFLIVTVTRLIRQSFIGGHSDMLVTLIVSSITWVSLCTAILIIENLKTQTILQYEVQRAEKLKVVSELAASVAHEVRNPMTATRGFLQLMKEDENLNAAQRRFMDISIEELDRAQVIIQDYLSLAKPNKQGISIINLSQQVENVIQLMSSYTSIKNIKIYTSVEQDLYIKANKDEIKQVLINLIKNGVEAVENGGNIAIYLTSKEDDVLIEIVDDGIGMSSEQLERLGTPFYSTKDKGTGIGLTITYQIIELLQGKIDVKSENGKGTTFFIKLPKQKELNI